MRFGFILNHHTELSKALELFRRHGCRSQANYLKDIKLEDFAMDWSNPKLQKAFKEFMKDE